MRSRVCLRFHLASVAALAAWLSLAAGATAQERARDYIRPRVDKTQFQRFTQDISLQSDQKQIVNIAFADYEATLSDLAKRLDEEATAAGRQAVDDSLSGKARLPADELRRLRARTQRVYLQAGEEADAALDALVWGVHALLTPDQEAMFEPALRALRREILLHPRQEHAAHQEYAGDGVDVLELVSEAQAAGGELEALPSATVDGILGPYAIALDGVLVDTASAERQGSLLRKIASIEKDMETLMREERQALTRWRRLYELNAAAVDQLVAATRAGLGEGAAAAFQARFDRACFTWLYPRLKPDRQIEWIRQAAVPPETLQKAEEIYGEYLARRDTLSQAAMDMMLRARIEFGVFLYAMMDPTSVDERIRSSLHTDLLKNTGDQSLLVNTTGSQLEAILDDKTRHELREAMKRPDRTARTPPPSR